MIYTANGSSSVWTHAKANVTHDTVRFQTQFRSCSVVWHVKNAWVNNV